MLNEIYSKITLKNINISLKIGISIFFKYVVQYIILMIGTVIIR